MQKLIIATLIVSLATPANAQLTFAGFIGIQIGISERLERLPDTIKRALIEGLTEALPLIDQRVDRYLEKIEETSVRLLSQTRCVIQGSGADFGDSLAQALANIIPFLPIPNSQPTQEAVDDFRKVRQQIGLNQSAEINIIRYSDLWHRTRKRFCEVTDHLGANSPSAVASQYVSGLLLRTQRKLLDWYMVGGDCGGLQACFERRYGEVRDFIASSDPKDREKINAESLFADIQQPRVTHGFAFSLDEFEQAFLKLNNIELALIGARHVRHVRFEGAFREYIRVRDEIRAHIAQSSNHRSRHDHRRNARAKELIEHAQRRVKAAQDALGRAKADSNAGSPQITVAERELADLLQALEAEKREVDSHFSRTEPPPPDPLRDLPPIAR